MVALAALIWLPRWAIAGVSFIMLGGHDLLDGVRAEQWGEGSWAWHILMSPGWCLSARPRTSIVLYPLIPWIGVMAAGYLLGPVMQLGRAARQRVLFRLGTAVSPGLHRPPRYQSIWRSGPTDRSTDLVFNYPVLSQLRISAIAALSDDALGPALMLLACFEQRGALSPAYSPRSDTFRSSIMWSISI